MTKIAVVALGGNALTRPGQSGTYDEMAANATAMAAAVNDVMEAGWRVVIVARQRPAGREPGDAAGGHVRGAGAAAALLGAMTQGLLGSLIARAIDLLRGRGTAAALVTHVTVDPADPAFGTPTKPIGPFFETTEAQRLAARNGWVVSRTPAAGTAGWWRRRSRSA